MFENIEWIFFDVGSTLVDEHLFRDIAEFTNLDYTFIYDEALEYYKQNKKGDIELGKKYHLPKRKGHIEDEILYKDVPDCLEILNKKYRKVSYWYHSESTIGNKKQIRKMGDYEIY